MTQYKPGDILLDKYRIEKLIGEGAFAEVYLATHIELNVPRALKILHKEAPGVGSSEFEDFQERFKLEAQLGSRINHPNVVHVYDFEHKGDALILVMEYCPGGNLAERIRLGNENKNLIPIDEAVKIGIETASGMGTIHALDAVHRDLKPSNILFDKNQCAKVADPGLAQIPGGPSMRSKLSQPVEHPGTPGYMSPEQEISRAYLSPTSDIYSLGLVLFELLTGRVYQSQRPGTKPSRLRESVPAWLDQLVVQMLSIDPQARSWDGSETASLLRQGLETGAPRDHGEVAVSSAAVQSPHEIPSNHENKQTSASGGSFLSLNDMFKNRRVLFIAGGLLLLIILCFIGGNWFIQRNSSDSTNLDATRMAFQQAVQLTGTRLAREKMNSTNIPSDTIVNTSTISHSLSELSTSNAVESPPPEATPTLQTIRTATQIPTPTPIFDTTPGSILEPGQIWRQGDAGLRMDEKISDNNVYFYFEFTNMKSQQIHIESVEPRVMDNNRISYDPVGSSEKSCSVNPGKTCEWTYRYWIELSDPGLTELIVIVDNISSITNAQWRIPIYH